MLRLRTLMTGAALAALAFTLGWEVHAQQNLTNRTLSGLEAWSVGQGGPGGPSIYVTTAQLRNSTGTQPTTSTSGTLVVPTTTATLISTSACGGTMTVDLPALPFDGEIFEWVNGTASTAFTTGCVVASTDGSTIVGSTAASTLAAGASLEFRYSLANNTWYKMR